MPLSRPALLAAFGATPSSGALLYGPPGTSTFSSRLCMLLTTTYEACLADTPKKWPGEKHNASCSTTTQCRRATFEMLLSVPAATSQAAGRRCWRRRRRRGAAPTSSPSGAPSCWTKCALGLGFRVWPSPQSPTTPLPTVLRYHVSLGSWTLKLSKQQLLSRPSSLSYICSHISAQVVGGSTSGQGG